MKEFHQTAEFYGHASILRRYARFPDFLPVPVGVQHGWHLIPEAADVIENGVTGVWSDRIRKQYMDGYTGASFRAIGAPFLYLLKRLNFTPPPPGQRSGTIVFPAHSTHQLHADYDYCRYAEMLQALPERYHPISVCMYYTDLRNNRQIEFEKAGFRILSNGSSRTDPEFLVRMIENMKYHRYAMANQMTTALLYAVRLGLRAYYFGPQYTVTNSGNEFWEKHNINETERRSERERMRYFQFPDADGDEQRAFAETELGERHLMSRAGMTYLLWKNALHIRYFKYMLQAVYRTTKATVRSILPAFAIGKSVQDAAPGGGE
jgi:hypothetical protein